MKPFAVIALAGTVLGAGVAFAHHDPAGLDVDPRTIYEIQHVQWRVFSGRAPNTAYARKVTPLTKPAVRPGVRYPTSGHGDH